VTSLGVPLFIPLTRAGETDLEYVEVFMQMVLSASSFNSTYNTFAFR